MRNVSGESPRRRLGRQPSGEVDAIAHSLAALERILAEPPTETTGRWRARLGRELANALGHLQRHCESATLPGGVVSEAELTLGRSAEVRTVETEHETLLRDAANLLGVLEERPDAAVPSDVDVRSMVHALMAKLKHHYVLATELLRETVQRDLGSSG